MKFLDKLRVFQNIINVKEYVLSTPIQNASIYKDDGQFAAVIVHVHYYTYFT